jgi:CxxC motif-containing protein (DUF1111 family)
MQRLSGRRSGLVVLIAVAAACGGSGTALNSRLGGETTREVTGRNSFGLPAPTLTNEERRVFEIGDSFFTQNWVVAPASTDARDGLGPMFNAQACSSCHLLDGRGIPASTGDGDLGLLLRLSVAGENGNGGPVPHPIYGDQLQDRSNPGIPAEGELVITYTEQPSAYADGTEYSLRAPTYVISSLAFGDLGEVMVSPRLAPQMIGMGLLEAIPEAELLRLSDPDDADGDGISGRVNTVWNPETERLEVGRFGWKANTPSVRVQTASAFGGDIGITSSIHPDESCTETQVDCAAAPGGGTDTESELTDSRLGSVTFYSRTLAVPAMRTPEAGDVRAGAAAFDELGCSSCHVTSFTTGEDGIAALSNQSIAPYTDLLLHDMGVGLADDRPDFEATGQEWRTAPLWGLGLIDDVNGERFLLHDGRARTIEEAILWHGGEGAVSMEAFRTADRDVRAALVAFLEAL